MKPKILWFDDGWQVEIMFDGEAIAIQLNGDQKLQEISSWYDQDKISNLPADVRRVMKSYII